MLWNNTLFIASSCLQDHLGQKLMVNGSLSEATWSEKMKGLDDAGGHSSSQIVYDIDSSSLRACKAVIKVEQRVRIHNNNNNNNLFCSLLQTSLCYKVCDVTHLLRPNQHNKAEWCKWSELLAARAQNLLKGTGRFWVINAQICILPHSRDSFYLIFDS